MHDALEPPSARALNREGRTISKEEWHRKTTRTAAKAQCIPENGLGRAFRSGDRSHDFQDGHQPKSVLILYTGGTIGMKKDEAGALAPIPGYFTEQIFAMDELKKPELPVFDVIEYEPLLDSACFTPADWERIASDIGKAYFHYDGFVVCMGTDTMAYAGSAISFMLENLGKTVVLTGSQIPFSEVYNDARRNLILSLILADALRPLAPCLPPAAKQEIPEVTIFFNDKLLRANRTVKVNNRGLSAFDSPNFAPLATLGVNITYRKDLALEPPRHPFRAHIVMDSRIIVVKLVPGFDDDALVTMVKHASHLKAVVLELYGTGNSPNRRRAFLDFIQVARERDVLLLAVTQCLQGGVDLGKYAVGAALVSLGVVSCGDMTTEAAVTKAAYLFATVKHTDAVARLMQRNLRGELSPLEHYTHDILRQRGTTAGTEERAHSVGTRQSKL